MVAALLVVSLELEESLQRVLFSRMKGPGVQAESPQVRVFPLQCPRPPAEGSTVLSRSVHGFNS